MSNTNCDFIYADNISYYIRHKKTKEYLLKDINISFKSGELSAIMGFSGCGKSTLLKCLSGYWKPSEGSVLFNNIDVHKHLSHLSIKGGVGYAPQDDIVHPELTVYQALYYEARLKFGYSISKQTIDKKIDHVLESLELIDSKKDNGCGIKDRIIGNFESDTGISGGQRKRVNVAIELLHNPSVLFIDEPTSGLSSEDADSIMDVLRKVADSGKAVVIVLHQPNLEIFKKIDKVVFLDHGGIAFSGRPHPDAIKYFNEDILEQNELIIHDPDSALRGLNRGLKQGKNWVSAWNKRIKKDDIKNKTVIYKDEKLSIVESLKNVFWQIMTLFARNFRVKLNDRINLLVVALQPIIFAALIIILFRGIEEEKPIPYFFLIIMSSLFFGLFGSAKEIVGELAIFKKETISVVDVVPYYLSKVVVLSIITSIQSAVFYLCVFYASVNPMIFSVWTGLLLSVATTISGVALGLLISSFAKKANHVISYLAMIVFPLIVFSGSLVSVQSFEKRSIESSTILEKNIASAGYMITSVMPTRWALEEFIRNRDILWVKIKSKTDPNSINFKAFYLFDETKSMIGSESQEADIKNRTTEIYLYMLEIIFIVMACTVARLYYIKNNR